MRAWQTEAATTMSAGKTHNYSVRAHEVAASPCYDGGCRHMRGLSRPVRRTFVMFAVSSSAVPTPRPVESLLGLLFLILALRGWLTWWRRLCMFKSIQPANSW
eukprot:TRINITY_DN93839_c0_g1_i1.p1 TRINITY_DN93839_c0_g1~~TRINITY_DN93839_c0_g1_i1.p1  ORF type:complete len:110 (-),score=5.33 TRINITY_DN93839_c0_g1_i1:330-638(-)